LIAHAPTDLDLVALADHNGREVCGELARDARAARGQFFSPTETARYLASCFSDASFSEELVLHDPGAGSGILTAAFVESLLNRVSEKRVTPPRRVTLIACERDDQFASVLWEVLQRCEMALEREGIATRVILKMDDWIEISVRTLSKDLLSQSTDDLPTATHAILNPPYKKLATSSAHRRLLSRIGVETSNLYAAFVWLSVLQIEPAGELCAITPRSFCNGPYFKPFRHALLDATDIRLLHQIYARNKIFQRDAVLQENIVYLLRRKHAPGCAPPTGGDHGRVTLARGCFTEPDSQEISLDEIVHPKDEEAFIHLPADGDDRRARDFVMDQEASLADLGLCVSTGPVVDFRVREDLTRTRKPETYPLVYPHLLKEGKVQRPPANSDNAENLRQRKKPVGILDTSRTGKFLIDRGFYVLTKRFTSKEERRRIVACVLDPADFPEKKIGIENHINYFHANGCGLSKEVARGLADYLNSPEVDCYFRQFNGHTQVNATDLRNLRYPTEKQLIARKFALV